MDYSLPGSSVHGIFQARVLERVAISFSYTTTLQYKIKSVFFFFQSDHPIMCVISYLGTEKGKRSLLCAQELLRQGLKLQQEKP